MTESDSAILNSVVTEEEGEGEEGSSAPASNQHALGTQQAEHSVLQQGPNQCCPSTVASFLVLLAVEGAWAAYKVFLFPMSQKISRATRHDRAAHCLQVYHHILFIDRRTEHCPGLQSLHSGQDICITVPDIALQGLLARRGAYALRGNYAGCRCPDAACAWQAEGVGAAQALSVLM